MHYSSFPAFVLHRRPYRETSLLVDVFSAINGRQSFVAKGARSAKGCARLLQPFTPLEISLTGRHELKNLQQVEATARAYGLVGNALFSALYLNEILLRLLPVEMSCEALFQAYTATLSALSDQPTIEPILREFELFLLSELGYELDLRNTAQEQQLIQKGCFYAWVENEGFVPLDNKIESPHCFTGDCLLAIANSDWHPASLQAAKRLTRLALAPLLGPRPLKSRELFYPLGFANAK